MAEYCTPEVLDRALTNYLRYQPTQSACLQAARVRWIPCRVRSAWDREIVRRHANKILQGRQDFDAYMALPIELQLAVCLGAIQGWADTMAGLQPGDPLSFEMTARMFSHLSQVSPDFMALSVRNWSNPRDGGRVNWQNILVRLRLTSVPVLMQVYVTIRNHWVSFDRSRAMGSS